MTTWTSVSAVSSSWALSSPYVLAGYVVSDYIDDTSDEVTWTSISSASTTWS